MLTRETIKNVLDELPENDLIDVYREYLVANDYYDDEFWSMDEFDELMQGMDPWDIASACFYGDFCPAHNYFKFNAYGNLESTDYPSDWIYTDDIAEWLERSGLDALPRYMAEELEEMAEDMAA